MAGIKLTEESKGPFADNSMKNELLQQAKGLLDPLNDMMQEYPWTSKIVLGFLAYTIGDAVTDKLAGENPGVVEETLGFGLTLLGAVMLPQKAMDWVNEKTGPQQQLTI